MKITNHRKLVLSVLILVPIIFERTSCSIWEKVIQSYDIRNSCNIEKAPVGLRCYNGTNDLVTVPSGQVCHGNTSTEKELTSYKCVYGRWLRLPTGKESGHKLRKRNVEKNVVEATTPRVGIGTDVAGPVGSVDGGVVRKLVAYLICAFGACYGGPPPNKPPSIRCPSVSDTFYARSGDTSAVVTWDMPSASDPDDWFIGIKLVSGQNPGSNFSRGSHTISYSASDPQGLKDFCQFSFEVKEIMCNPPKIEDSYMNYKCVDGYRYGSNCQLSCRGSFPLIGNNTITCEKNQTTGRVHGYWEWDRDEKQYCKQIPCPELHAPAYGALTCKKWNSTMCIEYSMQCNRKFDLPLSGSYGSIEHFDGVYICLNGTWSPDTTNGIPGCTVRRNPRFSMLPVEFSYTVSSYSDPSTQKEIKMNFIQKVKQVQQEPEWQDVCPDDKQCYIDNVEVKGQSIDREKRFPDILLRRKRETQYLIQVSFVIKTEGISGIVPFDSYVNDSYINTESMLHHLGVIFENEAEEGFFDVENATTELSIIDIECEPGRFPKYSTFTCGACPKGTYLNKTITECVACPIGTYKDDEDAQICTSCPNGTSTVNIGSQNETDCLANGNWNEWSNWFECSHSCGGGRKTRKRQCDYPTSDPEGLPCVGNGYSYATCNNQDCPGCPDLPPSIGTDVNCTEDGENIQCKVICEKDKTYNPGFQPLDIYRCGPETAFEWNGLPPSCSRVQSPHTLKAEATLQYDGATCANKADIDADEIRSKASSLLCVRNGTCSIDVQLQGCDDREALQLVSVTMSVPLEEGDNFDLTSYFSLDTELSLSLHELKNDPEILKLKSLNETPPTMTFKLSAECSRGKIQVETFCVECPPGTFYIEQGICRPCERGTFQNTTGQFACVLCPEGFGTPFVGAISQTQCTESNMLKPHDAQASEISSLWENLMEYLHRADVFQMIYK